MMLTSSLAEVIEKQMLHFQNTNFIHADQFRILDYKKFKCSY